MRILFYILDIPYIRLFTRHVFSANSTVKPCIKSTQINISRNHSKSLNLPDLQETVSNLRECIFHDFDVLANIAENGCTRKKPDIQYMFISLNCFQDHIYMHQDNQLQSCFGVCLWMSDGIERRLVYI